MKKYFLLNIFISLLVMTFLMSCSSDSSSSKSSGNSSLVSITVGGDGKTASLEIEKNTLFAKAKMFFKKIVKPDEAIAAIPSTVSKITFLITASDMTAITEEVIISGETEITEAFTVPNGDNRHFIVDAYDSADSILYSGEAFASLDGTDVTLDITMGDFQLQATDGIASTIGSFVNTIKTKKAATTASDLLPYYQQDYLNDGLDENADAAEFVTDTTSLTSLQDIVVDSITFSDPSQKIATVKLTSYITTAASPSTAWNTRTETFAYDTTTGKWLLYGNQSMGEFRVVVGWITLMTTPYTSSSRILQPKISAPQNTVNQVTVSGDVPFYLSNLIFTKCGTDIRGGITFDEFCTSGDYVLDLGIFPSIGSTYTFNITKADNTTIQYTQTIESTPPTITITSPTGHSLITDAMLGGQLDLVWSSSTFLQGDIEIKGIVCTSPISCTVVDGTVTSTTEGYVNLPNIPGAVSAAVTVIAESNDIVSYCRFEFQ